MSQRVYETLYSRNDPTAAARSPGNRCGPIFSLFFGIVRLACPIASHFANPPRWYAIGKSSRKDTLAFICAETIQKIISSRVNIPSILIGHIQHPIGDKTRSVLDARSAPRRGDERSEESIRSGALFFNSLYLTQ